ncbi:Di-glucose binding within endoplasmic reticulum [Musa troglodytarum]|uniref:Di-glucose binding within endoplasmic reticulum n=1 Tax=Musa troglodytarum TaxID=320322 RepID=A0A9E7I7J1_9LILI|nr:Di-glucose binding within endoplasmic reticulum [Musa troglodytarum]
MDMKPYSLMATSRRNWNIRFDEVIRSYDFVKNKDEPYVYKKVSETRELKIQIRVRPIDFFVKDPIFDGFRLRSLLCASSAFLLLATTLVVVAVDNSTYYVPRDDILLNCGASGQASSFDGRSWTGDTGTRYAPSLNAGGFDALRLDPSVSTVPYSTARVFTSPFTYRFPLSAGRTFIRLHFYPSDYSNHAASDAFFSVTSGPYTLLQNFSAYLTADALNFAYLIREYSVNVSTGDLNLTFTPSTTHPNSYAFVNDDGNIVYTIDPDQALETVYRLNVGGQAIPPIGDSGLFRSWDDDSPYIYGAAFVTLHHPMSTPQQDQWVQMHSGGIGIPVYKDYVVMTMGRGQMDLWVALHPDTRSKPEYYDAILNGLEVFKLYVDPRDLRKGKEEEDEEGEGCSYKRWALWFLRRVLETQLRH